MDKLVLTVEGEELRDLQLLADAQLEQSGRTGANDEHAVAELAGAILKTGVGARLQQAAANAEVRAAPASIFEDERIRMPVLVCMAAALLVLLVGGYGAKWEWTGFTGNRQLWDWMHLLLLPIALGTFPLWLQYSEHMSRGRKIAFLLGIAVFAVFVLVGYLAPLGWTGFQGNTLWDWITLILLPVALVTVRVWPTSGRHVTRTHTLAFSLLGAAWLITLIGGYGADWVWTGYQGNSLWDWLQLLLAPVAVSTVVIPFAVRWVSGDVARIAQERERERAA
jgi:heme/copper-type cytochrome/quinol oxidase subunit 4